MKLRPFEAEEIEIVKSFDELIAHGNSQIRALHHDSPTKLMSTPQGLIPGVNFFGNSNETPFVRNNFGTWSVRPACSYYIQGAIFFPWLPLLVTEDGRYIKETFEYIPQWADIAKVDNAFKQDGSTYYVSDEKISEAQNNSTIEEIAIVYSTIARNNYGHFILDGLSTAYAQHLALADKNHIFLSSQLTDWQKELVSGLKLNSKMREALKPTKIERAITSSHTAKHLQFPGRLSRIAVDVLRFQYATDDSAPKRVYIRRTPDSRRDISNRYEVEQLLEKYSFEFIDTSAMSPSNQIRALGRAEIIIGQNGAGMMNAFFAPTSAEIIDIMPDRYPDYWLRANSRQIGVCWNLLNCAVRDEDLIPDNNKNWKKSFDFKYHVPIDELDSALKKIISRRAALSS